LKAAIRIESSIGDHIARRIGGETRAISLASPLQFAAA